MASRRTYALLAIAASSYLLGFVLCIVGYSIPWLQPRGTYDSAIVSVGLVTACFKKFKFEQYIDRDQRLLDGCYRVNSPTFDAVKETVNPEWFARVGHMHFACILISALNVLLILGYVAVYAVTVRQRRKTGRPSTTLVYAKAACCLWFVVTFVVAILQIVEPSIFHFSYDRYQNIFYNSGKGGPPLYYTGGIAVTAVSAVCFAAATVAGLLIFIGACRKASVVLGENYVEKKMSGSIRGEAFGGGGDAEQPMALRNRRDGDGEAESADLVERLTRRSQVDAGADGSGDTVSRTTASGYRSEPRSATAVPAVAASESRYGGGSDERDRSSLASYASSGVVRPIPAPRRSIASKSQESLNRRPSEEARGPSSTAKGVRSSVHELRSTGQREVSPPEERGSPVEDYGRRRYSAGSSYRPPTTPRPPSSASSVFGRQPSERPAGSARRPDDLPLAQGGSQPRGSVHGSHQPSMSSVDTGSASVHYDSNPASGYKPKEMAMLRFISDRSQAMNAATARASASLERRRSGGGGAAGRSEPGERGGGSAFGPVSPRSPSNGGVPPQQTTAAIAAPSASKKNSMYTSY